MSAVVWTEERTPDGEIRHLLNGSLIRVEIEGWTIQRAGSNVFANRAGCAEASVVDGQMTGASVPAAVAQRMLDAYRNRPR